MFSPATNEGNEKNFSFLTILYFSILSIKLSSISLILVFFENNLCIVFLVKILGSRPNSIFPKTLEGGLFVISKISKIFPACFFA